MEFSINYLLKVLQFVYHTWSSETLIVQIIWLCIPIFFLGIMALLITLLYNRWKMYKEKRIIKQKSEEFRMLVVKAISLDSSDTESYNTITQKLSHEVKSEIEYRLINNIILKLKNSLSGELSQKLTQLYTVIGLEEYAWKKLNTQKWHLQIQGLRELIQMEITKNLGNKIEQFLQHKNPIVRREMQTAMVKLYGVHGLHFLNDYQGAFPEWHQIEILEILQNQHNEKVFVFIKSWLKAQNPDIVLFALKLVYAYSLSQYAPVAIDYIQHSDRRVRRICYKCIKKFNLQDAFSHLQSSFKNEKLPYLDKAIILNTLNYLVPDQKLQYQNMKNQLLSDFDYTHMHISA